MLLVGNNSAATFPLRFIQFCLLFSENDNYQNIYIQLSKGGFASHTLTFASGGSVGIN